MLVLSRKKGEEAFVAENIRIAIIDIRGDKVRLGIEAPREITVVRREIAPDGHPLLETAALLPGAK